MVAAALTLPGAVVESIIARAGVSVEVVAPGSLAISAREGRGEAQGVTKSLDAHSSHVITKDVVLDVDPGHAILMSLLKGLRSDGKISWYLQGRLAWKLRGGVGSEAIGTMEPGIIGGRG